MYSGKYEGHISAQCTRVTCPECNGRGEVLDAPQQALAGRTYYEKCDECNGTGTTQCSGCRADSGMDCLYECLSLCTRCGALEGAQLPVCPGVELTPDQHDANYAHYCAGTGPFAQATPQTLEAAVNACWYYYDRQPQSRRTLYFAVGELLAFKLWEASQ